jgi:hypothetical protein
MNLYTCSSLIFKGKDELSESKHMDPNGGKAALTTPTGSSNSVPTPGIQQNGCLGSCPVLNQCVSVQILNLAPPALGADRTKFWNFGSERPFVPLSTTKRRST